MPIPIVFVAFSCCTTRYRTAIWWGGFVRSTQLSDRNPKFSVAVRASADGRFTFEIFTVSGEPRTIRFEGQHYSSPADAERADYEVIAANGLQTLDIDKARRAGSGQEFSSSPAGEWGEAESGWPPLSS
jgi:hypothetical protein